MTSPQTAPTTMTNRVLAAARVALTPFDLRDGFFFGGLLIAGAGGWRLSPAWTLVAIGVVLTLKGHGPLVVVRRSPSEAS